MNAVKWAVYSTIVTTSWCHTIKVLKTTDNFENFKYGSGAQLKDVRPTQLVDVSVCFRFYFFAKNVRFNFLIHSKRDQDSMESQKILLGFFYNPQMSIGVIGFNDDWTSSRDNSVSYTHLTLPTKA